MIGSNVMSWEAGTLIDILESLKKQAPDIFKAVLAREDTVIDIEYDSNDINLRAPEQLCRDFLILLKHLREACTEDTISFEDILRLTVDDGAKLAHVAAAIGNLEAVKLIALHGASTLWERITYRGNFEITRQEAHALDIASDNLHIDVIHFLLLVLGCNSSQAVLIERVGTRAIRILCAAAHSGSVEIIEFLLGKKLITNVNQNAWLRISGTSHFHPPLYFLIKNLLHLISSFKINRRHYSRYIKCIWLLLGQGALINYDNRSHHATFLHMVVADMSTAYIWVHDINTTRSYHIKLLGALFLGGISREARGGGARGVTAEELNQAITPIIARGEKRHAALRQQFIGRPALYWAVLTALKEAYVDSTDPLAIEIGSYVQELLQESKWAHLITQPSEKYLGHYQEMVSQFKTCGLKNVSYQKWLYVVGTTWDVKTPDPVEANLAENIRASMITMHNHLKAVGIQLIQGKEVEGISAHRRWSILDWYSLSPRDRMVSQIIGRQMRQVRVKKANGLPPEICDAIHDTLSFPPSIRGLQFFPRPLINPQQLVNSSEPDDSITPSCHT
jgi:hypothetical protein